MKVLINPVMYIEVESSQILDGLESTLGGSASGCGQFVTSTDQLNDYNEDDFDNQSSVFKSICEIVHQNKFNGDIIIYC